jgi:outer membrane protein assembly factor BamB/orotate phosphoribosyltransferase
MVSEDQKKEDLRQAIIKQVIMRTSPTVRIIGGDERIRVNWLLDFRALLLQPQWLNQYAELFWDCYGDQYPFQVCGMETAAISLVAAIVMKGIERKTPINGLYARKSRKRQGMLKQLEGTPNEHPVILVDDLIHSGSTFDKQIKILTDANLRVTGIFVLIAFRDTADYVFPLAHHLRIEHIFSLPDIGLPTEVTKKEPEKEAFELIWRFQAPGPLYNIVSEKSTPALDASRIYFGTDNGTFYALNQADGSIAWTYTVQKGGEDNSIFSSPLLSNNVLYFGAHDGAVHALDTRTGKQLWEYSGADWVRSSPCINTRHGIIYIGLEFGLLLQQGSIVALDAKSGTRRWHAKIRGSIESSPLYIEQENLVVIGDQEGIVHAYDGQSGSLRWRFGGNGPIYASFSYDSLSRLICFGSAGGIVYALFAPDGTPRFGNSSCGWIQSTPCLYERSLFISSLDKKVYAISLETGETIWTFATKGRISASATLFEKSLWCGSNDGNLYEIDPSNGTLRSSHQFSERIVNKIVYNPTSKNIFVPTQANELYCLRKKT